MKRQKHRCSMNSQGVCIRAMEVRWQWDGRENYGLDGAGVHRDTIEFWGASIPKYVSTRSKVSRGNIGKEIHLVATI